MEFQELIDAVNQIDLQLNEYYHGLQIDREKRILARTVKLNEEVGELCEQVLSYNSMQRKVKVEVHNKESLADELADVIITTFLLAKSMDVNMSEALDRKVSKIKKRKM
jgi:NTP pyrophosphatase (non-canonical NTP hydrolase)